jgi:hypothetical protein
MNTNNCTIVPGDLIISKHAKQNWQRGQPALPFATTFAYVRSKPCWNSDVLGTFKFNDLISIIAVIHDSHVWFLAMNSRGLLGWMYGDPRNTTVVKVSP